MMKLLFPPKCVLCGKILEEQEQDLCADCRRDTEPYPDKTTRYPHLAKVTALWYYKENVRKSLLLFKFYSHRSYARSYGRLLAQKLRQTKAQFDVLTWVPISLPRLWSRGFDQSQLLAKALGQELNVTPLKTLVKFRHVKPQSRIKFAPQRRANILGAYRCVCPEDVRDKRILLVDDIFTTGATSGECARMLLAAGAKSVALAVVAGADHTNNSR